MHRVYPAAAINLFEATRCGLMRDEPFSLCGVQDIGGTLPNMFDFGVYICAASSSSSNDGISSYAKMRPLLNIKGRNQLVVTIG